MGKVVLVWDFRTQNLEDRQNETSSHRLFKPTALVANSCFGEDPYSKVVFSARQIHHIGIFVDNSKYSEANRGEADSDGRWILRTRVHPLLAFITQDRKVVRKHLLCKFFDIKSGFDYDWAPTRGMLVNLGPPST